ncbi:hypothetical protein OPQ81_004400 [Rhizoctonia solani]|nr:hypothetical protein OPQ81_004400 [Rhizoctonia solani]
MRLLVAYVLCFLVFGQLCVAAPTITIPTTVDIVRRAQSVIVNRPVTFQNAPVAQLGIPYAFQLDPKTFMVAESDSGALLKVQPTVTWERNPNSPAWLKFDSDKLIFSGTPDVVPEHPIRLQLVATAPESGEQNSTTFDLHISDDPPPKVISTLESQQNQELIRVKNASYLTLTTGVWIHPGARFSVQIQAFCSKSVEGSALYYNAYHPSNASIDLLPQWLKFNNSSLTFSGIAPIEPIATNVILRCSNVFGAGGPEQLMSFEVTEHMLELDGPVLPFEFTPGRMFTYNFHWLWHQLYLDGKFFAQAFSHMRFSNNSRNVPDLDVENSDDIGISFTLDEYPWLSFDRTNQTIYGISPITPINTQVHVTSLAASAWVQSTRPASVTLRPGTSFSYNFTLELIESVASNPNWDLFIHFNDPFDQTSWLEFDPITRILSGTVPVNSPPRDITALAISNAWGFNTTTSYMIIIDNPDYIPSSPKFIWNQITVALLISLVVVVLFVALTICTCCGLREGCLLSYPTLIAYYRSSRPSDQTLVENSSEFVTGCCGGLDAGNKVGDIKPHIEKEADVHTIPHGTHQHRDACDSTPAGIVRSPSPSTDIVPVNAPYTSTNSSATQSQLGSSFARPQTKPAQKFGIRKHLILFEKQALFRKGNKYNASNPKRAAISSTSGFKNTPFTPMWNGHIYQTPELLAAEEQGWQVRRQERKARLKKEYFARKQAENTGIETRPDKLEEKCDRPNPDAPRRFGIFEQLAAMEDLDQLPGTVEDILIDENLPDKITRGLGSEDNLDLGLPGPGAQKSEIGDASNTKTVVTYSHVKWKGKGVARDGHGSPITSQHSPTFKKLAHQRFRASVDGRLGSPLSRSVVGCTLASASPSARSIGTMVSTSGMKSSNRSPADVIFHVGPSGMQFYFVPARTEFCFRVRVTEALVKPKRKSESGHAKDLLYEAEIDGYFNTEVPSWLHFNPSTLEFWGQTPDTRELLQYSMRVVSRPANEMVCQLLMVVARAPLLTAAQASLGNPTGALDTTEVSSSGKLLDALRSPYNSQGLGSPLESSRSIVTSNFGSNLSPGSMASIVFRFNQDGVEVFVVPSNTKFCFEVPMVKPDKESAPTQLAFGRAGASPYSIQLEECDVVAIPHWLHFVPLSMGFWGEAPNVEDRLHIVMQIVHKQSGQVAGRVAIVITDMADAAQLQACFECSRSINEGLSVVEEVSSIISEDPQDENLLTRPQTPKRPQNPLPASSSCIPSSWRGMCPSSRRSPGYTSPLAL